MIIPVTAKAVMISPHETPTRSFGIDVALPLRRTSALKSNHAQRSLGAAFRCVHVLKSDKLLTMVTLERTDRDGTEVKRSWRRGDGLKLLPMVGV